MQMCVAYVHLDPRQSSEVQSEFVKFEVGELLSFKEYLNFQVKLPGLKIRFKPEFKNQ